MDNDVKASDFSQYFQSVFTNERLSDLSSLQSSLVQKLSIIHFISFTPDNVYQELITPNISKSCGPDFILPFLLKKAAAYTCFPLPRLFNQSILTGKLPQDWVTVNVVPVFKKGDPHLPSNYRSISLTSINGEDCSL